MLVDQGLRLNSVGCSGLRRFEDAVAFGVAPLTALLGANNSGKSTLLKLPMFALASVLEESLFALEHEGLRFGRDFRDLVHANQAHPALAYGLTLAGETGPLDCAVELQHVTAPDGRTNVVATKIAIGTENWELGDLAGDSSAWRQQPGLLDALETLREACQYQLASAAVLPGTRGYISSVYEVHEQTVRWGNVSDAAHALRRDPDLLAAVGTWLDDNLACPGLSVDSSGFAFRMVSGLVNLHEAGRGVRAAVPLVTLLIGMSMGSFSPSFVLIEEPEAHLHPSAQAPLADLLMQAATPASRIILETHSEALLLRIRRRIAEGQFDPTLFTMHYIQAAQEGVPLHTISVNPDGSTDYWPAGVFEYDVVDAEAIAARRLHSAGFRD